MLVAVIWNAHMVYMSELSLLSCQYMAGIWNNAHMVHMGELSLLTLLDLGGHMALLETKCLISKNWHGPKARAFATFSFI